MNCEMEEIPKILAEFTGVHRGMIGGTEFWGFPCGWFRLEVGSTTPLTGKADDREDPPPIGIITRDDSQSCDIWEHHRGSRCIQPLGNAANFATPVCWEITMVEW